LELAYEEARGVFALTLPFFKVVFSVFFFTCSPGAVFAPSFWRSSNQIAFPFLQNLFAIPFYAKFSPSPILSPRHPQTHAPFSPLVHDSVRIFPGCAAQVAFPLIDLRKDFFCAPFFSVFPFSPT